MMMTINGNGHEGMMEMNDDDDDDDDEMMMMK